MSRHEPYVTAAGRFGFTGRYDASIVVTMREARWRPVLCDRLLAGVPAGGRVLDVGAGTGTHSIALAAVFLALARAKPGAQAVRFEHGLAGSSNCRTRAWTLR